MAILCLACNLSLTGCGLGGADDAVYTLYRTSAIPNAPSELMRIHMATFDADGGEQYNRENCQLSAELFQAQPGVTVRYWCEKGRYRK
jgi:hypothetical protein